MSDCGIDDVMKKIKSKYSDEQMKQAAATFSQQQASMSGMTPEQMQGTVAKLNDLLTCGPACQNNRKTQDLYGKWQAAKYEEKNAPNNTAQAEKNYWLFSQGPLAYNNMLLKRYGNEAKNNLKTSTAKHEEFTRKLEVLINDYTAETKAKARLQELLKVRLDENEALKKAIDDDERQVATNDRRVVYEEQQRDWLHDVGKGLTYLYVIIVLVFLYTGPFFQESLYATLKGWLVPLAFIIFPFSVYYIARFIVYLYQEVQWFYRNKAPRNVFINI